MSGIVDGSFSHEMNQVNLVDLRVWKDGHEPFSIHYNVRNEGIKVSEHYFLDRSNLVIRLPHITPGADPIKKSMVSFSNKLGRLEERAQYVKMIKYGDNISFTSGFARGIQELQKSQDHGISILPVYEGNDIPISSRVNEFGRTEEKADRIEIQMLNENDGLIFHRTEQSNGTVIIDPERIFREMAEAPEGGYKRSIILDGHHKGETIYAYFHIDGKYGKLACGLYNLEIASKFRSLRTNILFMVQQDGSRNIAGWVK